MDGEHRAVSCWVTTMTRGVALGLCLVAPAALADRLVVALDPPVIESNLLWQSGLGEPLPWMQSLVGNDPLTGAYDDSGLARAWEATEDFTEWTFHLHEDAEFHFGWGPVTAHDVVHSYELHVAADATYVGAERIRAGEVEAIDDHTVVFRFDEAKIDYAFPHAGRVEMLVYSKAQYEAEGLEGYHERPAGTGPFRFIERRIGEGTRFEAVEDHWQGIEPYFSEIEFRWVSEPATKLAMLLAGEAHIADLPPELRPDAVDHGLEIIASRIPAMQTSMNFSGLYQVTGDPGHNPDLPWADVRVREAMNRALDRATMIEILYGEHAKPVVRFGMDPRHEGYVPKFEERFEEWYGYDPERAKELLAEAGYPDGFPDPVIPIASTVLAGNPEFATMAELAQVYFEEIGLQTEIREMDFASIGALGRAREAYLIVPNRNAPIRPSEAALFTFFTVAGSHYSGYQSDAFEAMVAELQRTIDPDERDQLAAEAFTYLFEQYADMPLAEVHAKVAVNPDVVADWTFPGVTTNSLSHWHLVRRAE